MSCDGVCYITLFNGFDQAIASALLTLHAPLSMVLADWSPALPTLGLEMALDWEVVGGNVLALSHFMPTCTSPHVLPFHFLPLSSSPLVLPPHSPLHRLTTPIPQRQRLTKRTVAITQRGKRHLLISAHLVHVSANSTTAVSVVQSHTTPISITLGHTK